MTNFIFGKSYAKLLMYICLNILIVVVSILVTISFYSNIYALLCGVLLFIYGIHALIYADLMIIRDDSLSIYYKQQKSVFKVTDNVYIKPYIDIVASGCSLKRTVYFVLASEPFDDNVLWSYGNIKVNPKYTLCCYNANYFDAIKNKFNCVVEDEELFKLSNSGSILQPKTSKIEKDAYAEKLKLPNKNDLRLILLVGCLMFVIFPYYLFQTHSTLASAELYGSIAIYIVCCVGMYFVLKNEDTSCLLSNNQIQVLNFWGNVRDTINLTDIKQIGVVKNQACYNIPSALYFSKRPLNSEEQQNIIFLLNAGVVRLIPYNEDIANYYRAKEPSKFIRMNTANICELQCDYEDIEY